MFLTASPPPPGAPPTFHPRQDPVRHISVFFHVPPGAVRSFVVSAGGGEHCAAQRDGVSGRLGAETDAGAPVRPKNERAQGLACACRWMMALGSHRVWVFLRATLQARVVMALVTAWVESVEVCRFSGWAGALERATSPPLPCCSAV